ncbi:MAG: hypothetical protein ACRCTQ_04190 [Brevinemataceae bacterium]
MRNILLPVIITILFAGDLFSQETSIITSIKKKKFEYQPHSIGVSTRLGLGKIFSLDNSSCIMGINTRVFDFYIGNPKNLNKRMGKTKYATLLQLRFTTPFMDDPNKGTFMNEMRWGVLFGGSQYVFDLRTQNGLGWSMLVNGGLSIDFPGINRMKDLANNLINMGVELDFKTVYNFQKFAAVTFGMNFGYNLGYEYLSSVPTDSSGYPLPHKIGINILQAFVWGINIGFLF